MSNQDDTGLTTSRHTAGVLPSRVSEAMQDSSSKREQAKSVASAKELRSRSAPIVAPESWRTENRREPVSSEGEHPEKGGTVERKHGRDTEHDDPVNRSSTDSDKDVVTGASRKPQRSLHRKNRMR